MQKSKFLMWQKHFGVYFSIHIPIIAVHLQNENAKFHKVV